MTVLELDTPHGRAKAHVHPALDRPRAALVLGHGAAGGVTARDLVAVTDVAFSGRVSVALVEQPYRVAGRRAPAPARQLDTAWTAVAEQLLVGELSGLPLVVGGRSMGARVACRTAAATGAVGVLCLAFPLQPPRRSGAVAATSRLPELEAVLVPTLVVQGTRDPFGIPPATAHRTVVEVPGDHSLRTDLQAVADASVRGLPASSDPGARPPQQRPVLAQVSLTVRPTASAAPRVRVRVACAREAAPERPTPKRTSKRPHGRSATRSNSTRQRG